MIRTDTFPQESELVTAELVSQLEPVLAKLDRPVVLRTVLKENEEKGRELVSFMISMVRLSPYLALEVYEEKEAAELGMPLDLLPITGIYQDGQFSGVSFSGIPAGKEINSFVLALYNTAGPGQTIDKKIKQKIEGLSGDIEIDIAVSLSCHYCQDVVTSCQRIASLNAGVKARMIDARLYPDFVKKYDIERIPVMIFNKKTIITGAKKLEEIIQLVQQS